MRPEYVRVQLTEKEFGHKNLLHTQLELISVMQHCEKYKNLRSEELVLKIALKHKIEEAKSQIALLEKLLPKPTIQPKEEIPEFHNKKEKKNLDQEIEEIRRKLSKLRYYSEF